MKIIPILAAAALAIPAAATAQSLNETHVLVWHPSGKTPGATYVPRAKPVCIKTAAHHRAGKGQFLADKACPSTLANAATPTPAN